MTDLCHGLDARTCFADTKTVSGEYLLVALRVQLREARRELKLFAVNTQRAVSAFLALYRIRRKALRVDAQEIAYARFLQLEETCYAVETHHMDDVFLDRTEYPLEHVIEMHADIRSYTAGLVHVAFP